MTTLAPGSMNDLLPDDILLAILAMAQKESGESYFRFEGHDFDLQRVFRELTQEFALLRNYFVFSSGGPMPYSPSLTESVSRLQLSGMVGRENPEYEFLFLKPAANEYMKRLEPKLGADATNELKKVAKAFLKRVVS
ncbi:MAG TPA: hypothetical protein VF919_18810 [Gemmatimonadales bacterium]